MSIFDKSNVNSMLIDSIELIKRETVAQNLLNAPFNPCIIIYLTEKTSSFQDTIYDGLHKYWGNRADFIPQLLYKSGSFYSYDENGSFTIESDIYDIIEDIRSYRENIFENKQNIKLYFYIDTFSIDSLEKFSSLLECVDIFNAITQIKFLSMLFYVEDSSIRPERSLLRKQFAELIINEQTTQRFNSLFWLSTNLYGGDVLKGQRESENYSLSTSLIFLSNNNDEEGVSYRGINMFTRYPNSSAYSASYISLSKPIKAIVANTYVSILEFLTNELFVVDKKLVIDKNDLLNALCISNNSLANEIYNKIIAKIPTVKDLKVLPNISNQQISFSKRDGISFDNISEYLNRITVDCWSLFYKYNYLNVINSFLNSEYSNENIKKSIIESLLSSFSYIELSQLIESKAIEAVEEYNPVLVNSKNINSIEELDTFIKNGIKNDIYDLLKPLYESIIREVDSFSEKYIENIDLLKYNIKEHAKINNDDLSGNISTFYDNIVRSYMHSTDNIQRIHNDFNNYQEKIEELFRRLSLLFSRIIESNPIYKSSFEEELNARLSAVNAGQANKLIAQALQNPTRIKAQIRINSSSEPYVLNTYYLVNGDSDYVNILDVEENDIINTGVSNSAETIVLYACSNENIIIR